MITKTTVLVVARAVEDKDASRDALRYEMSDGAKGQPLSADRPGYGQVEIVEITTVERQRNDGRIISGTLPERTERVLLTLDTAQAVHLSSTMPRALAYALDLKAQGRAYPAGIVTEERS